MRVFLDENMPLPIRLVLRPHDVSSVRREAWTGKRNGELLDLITGAFDVLLTSDGNLRHQNKLAGRGLSVIIVPTNDLDILLAAAPALRATLAHIASSDTAMLVVVDWKGRRRFLLLDGSGLTGDLSPVPPFGRREPLLP